MLLIKPNHRLKLDHDLAHSASLYTHTLTQSK